MANTRIVPNIVLALGLLAAVAFGSQAANSDIAEVCDCVLPPTPEAGTISLFEDIPYNTTADEVLRLDLAAPMSAQAANDRPLVIVLHGGGFAVGDKATGGGAAQRKAIQQLAGLGYVAISANYRLSRPEKNQFPAAVQDVRCLVRWARANAARYGIDPQRIAITGVSAGAGLAASVAVMDDQTRIGDQSIDEIDGYRCEADTASSLKLSSRVQGAVLYYAPSDFSIRLKEWGQAAPLIVNYLGGPPRTVPAQAHRASPINYVSTKTPSILLSHGDADDLVPYRQSLAMTQALTEAGASSRLITVPGVGHAYLMFDADYYAITEPGDDNAGLPACTDQEQDGAKCWITLPDMGMTVIKTTGVLRCSSCSALTFLQKLLRP